MVHDGRRARPRRVADLVDDAGRAAGRGLVGAAGELGSEGQGLEPAQGIDEDELAGRGTCLLRRSSMRTFIAAAFTSEGGCGRLRSRNQKALDGLLD